MPIHTISTMNDEDHGQRIPDVVWWMVYLSIEVKSASITMQRIVWTRSSLVCEYDTDAAASSLWWLLCDRYIPKRWEQQSAGGIHASRGRHQTNNSRISVSAVNLCIELYEFRTNRIQIGI